jgi:hypothetical protein
MDDRHLSEDELLDRLYGISAQSGLHLDVCAECRDRWEALCRARSLELARQQPDMSEAFLLHQRAELMSAIERRAARQWLPGPFPVLAAAMVCAVAVVLSLPGPAPEPYRISDAQFFSEVYSVAESNAPQSAAPIQNLFQGEQEQ